VVFAKPTEERHNAIATAVMHEANVPVHDLSGTDSERLAEAVADCVMRQWIVKRHSGPGSPHPGGPEAAAKYRKEEAEHDAEVPAAYKNLPIGKFNVPEDAAAWRKQRPAILRAVVDSLGDLPPRPAKTTARVVSRELRRGYTLERVSIDNGVGNDISALVLVPQKRQRPAPAILWLHSSTPDKNALITPGSDPESIGEAFVRNGYVVVAPDAWYYGDRAGNVPSGPRDIYRRGVIPHADITQNSLLKLNLWLGRTLWGMMVRDDQIALDYLSQRPEVDPKRIGATGMSMGSTRSWWLAAVDERVAATVGVACLTRYENLILHGNLRAHGLYYFTYGLLKHFDTEGVLALLAPRPFLALTGDMDYGSPVDGIRVLEEKVSRVYRAAGAPDRFKSIVYRDTGHVYTPEMRTEMLGWFERWLKPGNAK
jgi:dienelactone hydrolase